MVSHSQLHSHYPPAPAIMPEILEKTWRIPASAWDTHVHVFDPEKYQYSRSRVYSPCVAKFEQLTGFNQSITEDGQIGNIVLVQPSPYGANNSLILDLLKEQKAQNYSKLGCRLRAIVVLDLENTSNEELVEMDALGIRGIRLNTQSSGHGATVAQLEVAIKAAASRIIGAGLGKRWFLQLFIAGSLWSGEWICESQQWSC